MSIAIKPVFGEGREGRLATFQSYLKNEMREMFPSPGKISAESNAKCRLLYNQSVPQGALIYQRSLEGRSLVLQGLCAQDITQAKESPLGDILLQEVLSAAQEMGASSIRTEVLDTAVAMSQFLERNHFSRIGNQDGKLIYKLRMEKESLRVEKQCDQAQASSSSSSLVPPPPPPRRVEKQVTAQAAAATVDSYSRKRKPDDDFQSFRASAPAAEQLSAKRPKSSYQRTLSCPIMKKYFDMIRSGKKTVEGRINNGMFKGLRAGTLIEFCNGGQKVLREVTSVNPYKSFAEMLHKEGVEACLPDINSLQQGISIYNQIPGYSQRASQFGVIGIGLGEVKE